MKTGNRLFWLLGAVLFLAIFACTREEEPATEEFDDVVMVEYGLTAQPSDSTKAFLGDDGVLTWALGDELAVLDNGGSLCTFECTDAAKGYFSYTGPEGKTFSKAWFPASMVSTPGVITLPATISLEDALAIKAVPMQGDVVDDNIHLNHLAAVMRLTINNVPADATEVRITSPDVALSGDFAIVGSDVDGGQIEAVGENMTVDSGVEVKSPDQIYTSESGAGITIPLSLSSKSDLRLYVPLPCGGYKYSLSVVTASETLLSRTAGPKDVTRALLFGMKALSIEWPECNYHINGWYMHGGSELKWGAASQLEFSPADCYGWFKIEDLGTVTQGNYKEIRFKLNDGVQNYGLAQEEGSYANDNTRNDIPGTLIPLEAGSSWNINVYGTETSYDLYYNPSLQKIFVQESGTPMSVPSVDYSPVDRVALCNSSGALIDYLKPVPGQSEWRYVPGVTGGTTVTFKDPTATASAFKVNAKHNTAKFAGYKALSSLDSSGSAVSFKVIPVLDNDTSNDAAAACDIYVKTDGSLIFVLPAGSEFAVPEEYEIAFMSLRGYITTSTASGWDSSRKLLKKTSDLEDQDGFGWYCYKNLQMDYANALLRLYPYNVSDGYGNIGATTSTPMNYGVGNFRGLTSDGGVNIAFTVAAGNKYDIYIREDISKICVVPAGTLGNKDEASFTALSTPGFYGFDGKSYIYVLGQDQYAYTVSGDTGAFEMVEGRTFERAQAEGLPASFTTGASHSISVEIIPSFGSSSHYGLTFSVLKVEGSRVWLYNSSQKSGIILETE